MRAEPWERAVNEDGSVAQIRTDRRGTMIGWVQPDTTPNQDRFIANVHVPGGVYDYSAFKDALDGQAWVDAKLARAGYELSGPVILSPAMIAAALSAWDRLVRDGGP